MYNPRSIEITNNILTKKQSCFENDKLHIDESFEKWVMKNVNGWEAF